jgi:hypothetical protein
MPRARGCANPDQAPAPPARRPPRAGQDCTSAASGRRGRKAPAPRGPTDDEAQGQPFYPAHVDTCQPAAVMAARARARKVTTGAARNSLAYPCTMPAAGASLPRPFRHFDSNEMDTAARVAAGRRTRGSPGSVNAGLRSPRSRHPPVQWVRRWWISTTPLELRPLVPSGNDAKSATR